MDPLVITVAGIGAELTREQQPNLPLTAEEIGRDAAEVAEAGASIYHLHVRDAEGRPTMDVNTYRAAHDAIRSGTDLIVQFSSGGSVADDEEARMAPLALRPEMATLTTGTVNFGDDVFMNPEGLVARLYNKMRSLGIQPEFEIFDSGMLDGAERVYTDGGGGHHRHYDFVLGVPGGMPAWPDSISFLEAHLPEGATWTAAGIGRAHASVAGEAIERGGHVRTGFEDVRYVGPGELAGSNRELVENVVRAAAEQGREVATPAQARELLNLQ